MSKKDELSAEALAKLADRWWETRQARLEADKAAAALKSEENQLKAFLSGYMKNNSMTAVGGHLVKISYVRKVKAIADNWDDVYNFILENEAFDLLERRLSQRAFKDRVEEGENIPGTNQIFVDDISYSQVKGG